MLEPIPTAPVGDVAELRHDSGERYSLFGTISFDNAGPILTEGQRQFIQHERVLVDLQLSDVASTAGLAVLMEWAAWCGMRDIDLLYDNAQPAIFGLAEMNGVRPLLPLLSDPLEDRA